MPTLTDVIHEVASRFEVAFRQTGDHAFVLEIAFDDGRTQVVSIGIADDNHGETWVTAQSIIGDLADLDAEALLGANAATGYAFVAASEGTAYACAQLPLSIVDVDLCKSMIWSVAVFADSIEEATLGSDDA